MAWGRDGAAPAAMPQRRVRYGMYSLLLAALAPCLVAAAFTFLVNLPKDSPYEDTASITALAAYLLVAPVLHLLGIGFAIAGLRNPNAGRVASVLGLVFNIVLLGLGVLLGAAGVSTIGAFT